MIHPGNKEINNAEQNMGTIILSTVGAAYAIGGIMDLVAWLTRAVTGE